MVQPRVFSAPGVILLVLFAVGVHAQGTPATRRLARSSDRRLASMGQPMGMMGKKGGPMMMKMGKGGGSPKKMGKGDDIDCVPIGVTPTKGKGGGKKGADSPVAPSYFCSETPSLAPSRMEALPDPSESPSESPSAIVNECSRLDELLTTEGAVVSLDIAPPFGSGILLGDVFVWEELSISAPGFADGTSTGRCVVVDNSRSYCDITWIFPEGSILLQGDFSKPVAIGGTGCYQGITAVASLAVVYAISVEDRAIPTSECDPGLFAYSFFDEQEGIYIDWNGDGPSAGDSIVHVSNTIETPDGNLGLLEGDCTFIEELIFCALTWSMGEAEGTPSLLLAQGPLGKMIITGGTGCYFGASGFISGPMGRSYAIWFDYEDSAGAASCTPDIFLEPWEEDSFNGGDVFIDYTGDGFGAATLFDNNVMVVPLPGGRELEGRVSGRCFTLTDPGTNIYCQIVIELDEGLISLQGNFLEMTITGGSGCFRGIAGTVFTDISISSPSITYEFMIE